MAQRDMGENSSTDELIPQEHESAVRKLMASCRNDPYESLHTLDDAKSDPDGAVILEGDFGGQIYATVPARMVHCSELDLQNLLHDLDAIEWPHNHPDSTILVYERLTTGSRVAGGMGGGVVVDGVWVHERLRLLGLEDEIRDVVEGKRERLGTMYDDVYAILEIPEDVSLEHGGVVKVVWSFAEAESEIARLQEIDRKPTYRYAKLPGSLRRRRTPLPPHPMSQEEREQEQERYHAETRDLGINPHFIEHKRLWRSGELRCVGCERIIEPGTGHLAWGTLAFCSVCQCEDPYALARYRNHHGLNEPWL